MIADQGKMELSRRLFILWDFWVNSHPERMYIVNLPFNWTFCLCWLMRKRRLVRQRVDVTSLIRFQAETYGATTFNLYVELPDPLPDVVPEGSENSGFETGLIDWDLIEVPLSAN